MKHDESQYNGKITILFDGDGMRIDLRDTISSTVFVRARLNREQACQAMSRLFSTPCEIETRGLEKVGKKMEMDTIEFEIPCKSEELAKEIVCQFCPEGWEPDKYFASQESFRRIPNGGYIARTTIRRWVNVDSKEANHEA